MSNQPLDKGRLVAVVEKYQARENGQLVFNQDQSPKMKPKYMAIGEATKWPNDTGGYYVSIKQFLNPPSLPCETKIFWDSEQQGQQPQQPQQNYAPPQHPSAPPQNQPMGTHQQYGGQQAPGYGQQGG